MHDIQHKTWKKNLIQIQSRPLIIKEYVLHEK